MGNSEARTITFNSSPDPKSVPDPKIDARKKREGDALILRVYGEPEPAREIWPGNGYELAQKVRSDLGAAWTQPGKFTAALEQACQRYKQKNGKRFTAKSLRNGLLQWDEKQIGKIR